MPRVDAPELLYRTTFRILVLRNADALAEHDRVLAIAIDQNLAGRGGNVPEALDDLRGTIEESLRDEWRDTLPSYQPDPVPEYDRAFTDRAVKALDDDAILARMALHIEVFAIPAKPSRSRMTVKPRMVFEEACAVG